MDDFIGRVEQAMTDYFRTDRRRIEHARQVAEHARRLLDEIAADRTVTLAAAYLHDIGIPAAERKYGSSAGRHQEVEGPPVASDILKKLGASEAFIEKVCELVGNHHTPEAIDSPEFQILWDADALVNLAEVLPGKTAGQVNAVLEKSFATDAGLRRGRTVYLRE
ncbi:MAG: phosphohydrolase [Desulfuromonas sp.]|uniref:HD domain-containing protein n=1 Tax=Desulfuromonas sp. TaxID=892 RepID=UPI000CB2FDE2|nr:HD domain-containing protein [Desulfuromonas sp.]PLX83352.1 MAG: phosphohydrolase [Desulfuromonas sp.]